MSENDRGNKLDKVHHLTLNVSNIAEAVQWYSTSFRCEVLHEEKTKAIIAFENLKLWLVLPSQRPTHLAFTREDAATLGTLKERVDGSRSTFIADASGNPVEIVET